MNAGKLKDYYQVLGVGKNATQKEIKNAYRKLAREHHPDVASQDKAAEERFKEVAEAYDILGKSAKRSEYDRQRDLFAAGGGPWSAGGWTTGGRQDVYSDAQSGFGSIFEDLFQSRPTSEAANARGEDLYYTLTLGFKEALAGSAKRIKVSRQSACPVCGGKGAKPGTGTATCDMCGGRGVVAQNQGFFSLSRACPRCGGEGTIIKEPCSRCHGAGVLPEEKSVTVDIPAGIHDGGKLKYRGLGQAGRRGGPTGDLYIIIQVREHPLYKRKGSNIHLDMPIKFTEAALGAVVKVPTVSGRVSLKIPAGTQTGQTFRIKGKGAPKVRGLGVGDMLVTVRVEVPSEISPAEKELLVRLADQSKENPRVKMEELAERP